MEDSNKEIVKKNLNQSIISIRVKLQNSKLKKTGKNTFAGFDYFELSDFLPRLNELMQEEGINDLFTIETDINEQSVAKLTLIKGNETQEYRMPFKIFDTPLTFKKDKSGNILKDKEGNYIQVPSMQDIQYLGALNTYYKRYLYINAFGITDGDVIDAMPLDDLNDKKKKKEALKVSPKQIEILLQYYKDDNLKKLLDLNKIEKIEDLPMSKANELISSIIKKGKKEEEK
jgi:hypothetical protein